MPIAGVFELSEGKTTAWRDYFDFAIWPHVASATVETRKAMGDLQVENLHLHFAGKPVKTPISP